MEKAEEEKRLVKIESPIPPVAQGHEACYRRFVNGALIYRPDPKSDVGMVTLPIRALGNPLEGTFDLSCCGDTGKKLSIATGYRKGKKPENANKVEVWMTPRFLIQEELNTTAAHFRDDRLMLYWRPESLIHRDWTKEIQVGLFWNWGSWDDLSDYAFYVTDMDDLSERQVNLSLAYGASIKAAPWYNGLRCLYMLEARFESFQFSFPELK